MNLLTDPWVPVMQQSQVQHITLQDILCQEEDWQIACPRDDFELATLQLLICLTQVIFTPDNALILRARHEAPLSQAEFEEGVEKFLNWFDLLDEKHPFMQTRGVKAADITPIQKLFIGLPEGNNHAFFNAAGEVKCVGINYAAIALFHQASNCPSFGGGFKGSLRGGAPASTFIKGASLRQTLWLNVLHQEFIDQQGYPDTNPPVWLEPIKAGEKIYAHHISLLRGLFWQPAHIELLIKEGELTCDLSSLPISKGIYGFKKEKFNFEVVDNWRHPHSPLLWFEKKGQLEKKYTSFTTTAPAWTQLSQFILKHEEKKEGYEFALTVSQFQEVFPGQSLSLLIGGYRNKQAAILERRFELMSLSEGWDRNERHIKAFIDLALEMKTTLRNKLYGFGKEIGIAGLADQAEKQLYSDSEALIHSLLRNIKWNEVREAKCILYKQLSELVYTIFEEVTQPYQHEPKMVKALVTARRSIRKELNQLNPQEVAKA